MHVSVASAQFVAFVEAECRRLHGPLTRVKEGVEEQKRNRVSLGGEKTDRSLVWGMGSVRLNLTTFI